MSSKVTRRAHTTTCEVLRAFHLYVEFFGGLAIVQIALQDEWHHVPIVQLFNSVEVKVPSRQFNNAGWYDFSP